MAASLRATLIGCVALLLWSALATLTAYAGAIPPFQMVAMAFALAALLGAATMIARGAQDFSRMRAPVGTWALGVAGLFGYHFFYFVALRLAPPVEANLLNYLWPLLIVLFSALLPGARLEPRHVGGALLGLAGAALLILGPGADFESRFALGYAAALVCAVTWSAYSVANRRYRAVASDAVAGSAPSPRCLPHCAISSSNPRWRRRDGNGPRSWPWASVRSAPPSMPGTMAPSTATSARWERWPMRCRCCRAAC